jgi:hypothetical protein
VAEPSYYDPLLHEKLGGRREGREEGERREGEGGEQRRRQS